MFFPVSSNFARDFPKEFDDLFTPKRIHGLSTGLSTAWEKLGICVSNPVFLASPHVQAYKAVGIKRGGTKMLANFKIFAAAVAVVLTAGSSALAQELFPRIHPGHPDYELYRRAIKMDAELIRDNVIADVSYTFNSATMLKPVKGATPVAGRIVRILDGTTLNPHNALLSINGAIYHVRTEVAALQDRITVARRWVVNRGAKPGLFLVFRGYRAGALRGELIPVLMNIRIAETDGRVLENLEYFEDPGVDFH